MLEEVGDPAQAARLEAGAALNPNADRDRRHAGHMLRDDAEAVRERGTPHHRSRARAAAGWRTRVSRLQRFFATQANLARAVDLQHLDRDLVAFLQDVRDALHAARADLRDVQEAVGTGHDLDEGAEVDDAAHDTFVDLADLRLHGDALDDL